MAYHELVEWRRNKVLDLLTKGLNQYEIKDIVKVSKSTVYKDIQFLKQQAKENMKNHFEDRLTETFEYCFNGVNQVLKIAWETSQSTEDDKTRLQALQLTNECYKHKMDLVTNGVVIDDALKFVKHNAVSSNNKMVNNNENTTIENVIETF